MRGGWRERCDILGFVLEQPLERDRIAMHAAVLPWDGLLRISMWGSQRNLRLILTLLPQHTLYLLYLLQGPSSQGISFCPSIHTARFLGGIPDMVSL